MWIKEYVQHFEGVKLEAVWKILTDINHWHTWHGDLDYCKLEGDFEVGNHFILKPTGGPKVKIELIDIKPLAEFTDLTRFFGAKMYDTHKITQQDTGILIENKLVVTGPLSWLWIKLVAQNVADTVPAETQALIALAQSDE